MDESVSSNVLLINNSNEYAMYMSKVCKGGRIRKFCDLTTRNYIIKSVFLFQPDNTFL
jgi:hypothetical protein